MANMYNWWPNFKTVEELKNYVDWVANENNIDHETALNAIVNANQVTIQWKKVANWEPTDDVVKQLIPERNPIEWEAWYQAPKSFSESMWDALVEWIKDDITNYPKRKFWELATGWYFNWDKVNTKKILDEAWIWKKWNKKTDKETDKETTNPNKKGGEKTSGWLLKFGKDATSIEQIENRDKQLAQILNDRWITDISKVEEFLNNFNSFKEATPENKQRTISRIFWNIKDLNKDNGSKTWNDNWPQWIYIDQEDYKWTPEAKEGLDMYNKYAQVEAEKWDSSKVFRQMMWEAPTSNNTTAIRNKLKDAWLSTAQINDFTQAWADAYYKVDNDSPINDVKEIKKPNQISLKKSQKNTNTKNNNNDKWKKINIVKWSDTIKNLLKSKK